MSTTIDTGLVKKRISLQTAGQTYHIEVDNPNKEGVREIVRFVRRKIAEANQPNTVMDESQEDPLNQIEKLQELHEKGAISKEEFEEKKQDLLDKV
ncbi:MAG: SHOCT domain-containing protein [Halanaeroarchaeum sp.]